MKVKIGGYKNWIGPYQIAETILFFIPKKKDEHGFPYTDERVHKFGEWLAHGSIEKETDIWKQHNRPTTWLYKLCLWIETKRKRTINVRIDKWDTWSMDHTLAYIILPMLKQLKATKHGAPFVEDKDVPKELRSTSAPPKKDEYDTDGNHFKRWDWVMDEMIWAFEQKLDDNWEAQYYSGESDLYLEKVKGTDYSEMKEGPNHTQKIDMKGLKKHQERMRNGFRLFGKYYEGLWD